MCVRRSNSRPAGAWQWIRPVTTALVILLRRIGGPNLSILVLKNSNSNLNFKFRSNFCRYFVVTAVTEFTAPPREKCSIRNPKPWWVYTQACMCTYTQTTISWHVVCINFWYFTCKIYLCWFFRHNWGSYVHITGHNDFIHASELGVDITLIVGL